MMKKCYISFLGLLTFSGLAQQSKDSSSTSGINVPNTFTPNGDGKNDTWIITNINKFPDNVVEVFNRWGEKVFSSNGYKIPFDGFYKNQALSNGSYYYTINLNNTPNSDNVRGMVTILK